MKYLLLASMLFLAGCQKHYPKYTYGTSVDIVNGFYKGVTGFITGWNTCTDRDTEAVIVCYKITAVNGLFIEKLENEINEKDIAPHKQD